MCLLIVPTPHLVLLAPSQRVSTIGSTPFQPGLNCTLPNLIETDEDHNPLLPSSPQYPLRSRSAARHIPVCYSAIGASYAHPTGLFIAFIAHCTAQPPITLIANDAPRTANSVIDKVTFHSLEYHHLIQGQNKDIWSHSLANNLNRLTQGVGTHIPTGTNTDFH